MSRYIKLESTEARIEIAKHFGITITPDFVYDPESDSLLDFVYEVFEKKIRWHRPGVSYVCTDQGDVFMVEYMCAKHECEFFSRSTMESLKITWLKEYNFLDKLPIYNRELGMTHFFNFCGTEFMGVKMNSTNGWIDGC